MASTRTLTITDLRLETSQSITLSYHRKSKAWWAVLWDENGRTPRALESGEAPTPHAALAELLIAMGARPDRMD